MRLHFTQLFFFDIFFSFVLLDTENYDTSKKNVNTGNLPLKTEKL